MKTAEKIRMAGQPLEVGDSLTRYLTEISRHELLTADEEVELAQAIEAAWSPCWQVTTSNSSSSNGKLVAFPSRHSIRGSKLWATPS